MTTDRPGLYVAVTDTPYHITTDGTGAETTLTVRDPGGQPASTFSLRDARMVALALVNTSIALDAYPPRAQRSGSEPSTAAPWMCSYPTPVEQR